MSESVTVDEKALVREWRTGGRESLEILWSTDLGVDEAVRVLDAARLEVTVEQAQRVGLVEPVPTPRGPVIFVDYCDSAEDLLDAMRRLRAKLEARGVRGRVRTFRSQYSPLDDPVAVIECFTAAVAFRGRPPDTAAEDDPAQWDWDTDAAALRRVLEQALRWCHVPGGDYYVAVGLIQMKLGAQQCAAVLERGIGASPAATVVCTNGKDDFRRVAFDRRGHVLFERGGAQVVPDWRGCVAELRAVLEDVADSAEYGLIKRNLIPQGLWSEVIRQNWPNREPREPGGTFRARPFEGTTVPDAYGIQLLGPGHRDRLPTGREWNITPAGSDAHLVAHTDLAAWYAEPLPDLATLERARRDLEPLLITRENVGLQPPLQSEPPT